MGESFLLCAEESLSDHLNVLSERKQMNLIDFHRKLGHASENVTKKTANRLGIKLVGPLNSCEDCILGKIQKKNLKKCNASRSKIPGEKILIDISYIKRRV
jgi:hypothetical protein